MGQSVKSIRKALTKASSLPVEQSSAMPSGYYVSEEFRLLEEKHVFRKEWVCLGRATEVAEPGSFYTTTVINEPLLVTKDRNHEITVLSNVCRHRGNIIASGSGKSSRFTCGYHAWTYDLKGRLIGAPFMNEVKDFDPTVCSLPRFKTEIWQGFLFVNLSGMAKPLAPRLEQLMPYLENYEIDKRPHAFTKETTWATNWKCLAENFMEGYHLDVTHPTTLRPLTPTSRCEYVPSNGNFNAYYSYYDPSYPERGPFPTKLTAKEKRCSFMFGVFPNLVVAAAPNILIFLCLTPNTSNAVNIRWGMSPINEDHDLHSEQIDFMGTINLEDKEKLETLQKGLQSRYYEPGRLAKPDLEGTVHDMYCYMSNHLGSTIKL